MIVNSMVINKHIPLNVFYPEETFLLLKVSDKKEYANGEYTGKTIGYIYEVVELVDFTHLKITVLSVRPVITDEELQLTRKDNIKTYVSFKNACVTPYVNYESDRINDSLKAEGIQIVDV